MHVSWSCRTATGNLEASPYRTHLALARRDSLLGLGLLRDKVGDALVEIGDDLGLGDAEARRGRDVARAVLSCGTLTTTSTREHT